MSKDKILSGFHESKLALDWFVKNMQMNSLKAVWVEKHIKPGGWNKFKESEVQLSRTDLIFEFKDGSLSKIMSAGYSEMSAVFEKEIGGGFIHTPENTSSNCKVYLDGVEVKNACAACPSEGWVELIDIPVKLGENKSPRTTKKYGDVRVITARGKV